MPTFKGQDNKSFVVLPEGDYIFVVRSFTPKISTGVKTSGSPQWEFQIEIEGKGATVKETLTDHPSCDWKIDTFLRCCNVNIPQGVAYEFERSKAQENNVKWVNPCGLRGWCRLSKEPWSTDQNKFNNKIVTFYTDKQKLQPAVSEVQEPEETNFE